MGRQAKIDPEKACAHCGVVIRRNRIRGRLEDRGVFLRRQYCNRACMAAAMQKDRCSSTSHSRSKAARQALPSCETCGSVVSLHVHHKNRDHFDNSPSNLMTLCASCHRKSHSPNWEEGGGKRLPCKYCQNPSAKRGLCSTHLSRQQRYGHPLAKKRRTASGWVLMYECGGEWFSTLSALAKKTG